MSRLAAVFTILVVNTVSFAADETTPRAIDKRLKIELFAESPQIVTPTGMDVDLKGRVWAIESNTHFPPEGYKGHPTDRILVMSDTTGDGKADRVIQFADGLTHTMSIAVRPSGDVYVATRREIFIFNDDDGDDVADGKKRIVHLETKGNYPHNGLAGFAFDAMTWTFRSITSKESDRGGMRGWMYFGFGENLGADYKIIGSDGKTLAGGGEGGNVYRCRIDGSELSQWATGFWNPHASCIDAFGRLFTVDNDPDSLPPCRLLHIVEGGDYGYRFRNGRKGMHPFTAWNGEIPGTLPMVAGTGEAPSGIVAYESDGFPTDYIGNLLVGSWGDHRIDRFRLQRKGASFVSIPEPIIQGDENFRPVGLAVAPDGSLYCTDWVLRDYKLHQRGRVWRISSRQDRKHDIIDVLRLEQSGPKVLQELLDSKRLELRRTAASILAGQRIEKNSLAALVTSSASIRKRLESFWALAASIPSKSLEELMLAQDWTIEQINETDAVAAQWNVILGWGIDPHRFDDLLKRTPAKEATYTTAAMRHGCPLLFLPIDDWKPFLETIMSSNDAFLVTAAIDRLSRAEQFDENSLIARFRQVPKLPAARLAYLLAARRKNSNYKSILKAGLRDPDTTVRRVAVQWAAEHGFSDLRSDVESVLQREPMTTDLFLATIAALEMLDGTNPADIDKTPASKYVLPIVRDSKRSANVRAQALRLVDPKESALDTKLLANLTVSKDRELKLEAVRTLQSSPIKEAGKLLQVVAKNESLDATLRAEAIVGMARVASETKSKELAQSLIDLVNDRSPEIQREALRGLRTLSSSNSDVKTTLEQHVILLEHLAKLTESGRERAEQLAIALAKTDGTKPDWYVRYHANRPTSIDDWLNRLAEKPPSTKPDPAAGRRIFFHVHGAGCYKCHTINGRGGKVGPNLSTIGRSLNRRRLLESILEPSKEIAPQFTAWTFVAEDGKVHNGMIVEENRGNLLVGDSKGQITELKTIDIVERTPQKKSLMPDKLVDRLTLTEFRDLVAFLESLK